MASGHARGDFMPAVYVIDPNSSCNLRCVMCPNKYMAERNLGPINIDVFSRILDEIAPYAEFVMLYWMGEPLLNDQLPALLALARSKLSGKIVVSSNMTVLTPETAAALVEYADIVLCCIDRWDARAFEKVRQGASFDAVVENTNKLVNRRTLGGRAEIVVKALDINQSESEWQRFSEYWRARGARPLLAWLNSWAGTFQNMQSAASLAVPATEKYRVPCADLWFKMVINSRGGIQMCCFDWDYSVLIGATGDNGWLSDVWQGDKIVKIREHHLLAQYDANPLCSKCDTWGTTEEFERYVEFDERSYFSVF